MRQFISAIRLFFARAHDARRHPQRPPILGVRFANRYTRSGSNICTDVALSARMALARCCPTVEIVTVSPRFWRCEMHQIPDAAWTTWKVIPTGQFIEACQRAGVAIGTYHTSGQAALVGFGFDHRTAERLVNSFAATAR